MGLLGFFKRLNCFGSSKRKAKFREMKIQMDDLSKKIRVLQEDVLLKREIIAECRQQKEAEEKCEMACKRRGELMTQVEEIEVKLWEKLTHRKMVTVQIINGIVERESMRRKTRSLEKKATSYMEELNHEKQKNKTWKENLRPVRSQSDIHKATPKPPLAPLAHN